MAYQHLDVRNENGVDWVTMNRPEQLNALNKALVQDLNDYFGGLTTRSPARVVVLRGAGRAFSAGLDLKEAMARRAQGNPTVSDNLDSQHAIRNIALKMRRCPQPIISIVQGSAAGGGFAHTVGVEVEGDVVDALLAKKARQVLTATSEAAEDRVFFGAHRLRGDLRQLHRAQQPFAGHEAHNQFFTVLDDERRDQHGQHQRGQGNLFDGFWQPRNFAQQHEAEFATGA